MPAPPAPSSREWSLLRCAHCEDHIRIPLGTIPAYIRCPSCGGIISPTSGLSDSSQRFAVHVTRAASLPNNGSATPGGGRIPAILPRDSVPSSKKGLQSPEFGGASYDGPPRAAAPSPSPVPQSAPASNDSFIPRKRDLHELAPRRPAGSEDPAAEYVKPEGWEIEQSDEKPVSAPDPKTPRAVLIALTGFVLAACTWVTFTLVRTSKEVEELNAIEAKARREALEAAAPKDPAADARMARRLASEAAYDFLHSQKLRNLKTHIREAEYVGAVLDRVYPDPSVFKPFEYTRIANPEDIRISDDGKFFFVDVVQKDGTVKPLVLERVQKRQFLADWQSYVGYSEMSWPDLLVERPSEPVLMRARVRPADYYGGAFDNEKLFASFALSDDARQVTIYGYVPARTTIATRDLVFTEEEIAEGKEKLVMLSIRYPENTRKTNQVHIEEFVNDSWFRR